METKYIFGIRAVIEAIEAGKEIDKILVKKDLSSELAEELLKTAREHKVMVQKVGCWHSYRPSHIINSNMWYPNFTKTAKLHLSYCLTG